MGSTLTIASGLAGAAGIALAAVGSHTTAPGLGTAGLLLAIHAAASLALAGRGAGLERAALILLGGSVLFAADVAARAVLGARLFPYAAPLGGSAMILGWLWVAVAAAWKR